ncbi:MAG TPA: prephenate dehydrogenase/arogenate dehydrogenase family protein [Thermoanaerobaculia bacterium]|nr:prephenate dehydrogenase/arogenate dehydrogenase family protein [Thermoanaerobaculia bacterium]
MRRELLIVGLGLIGGSAGIALRRRGWRVRYLDPHVAPDDALRAGAADERATAIGDDDLVLLATSVDVAVELLRGMDPRRGMVTSVCSVMQPLRDAAKTRFVAGHPMAGSEARGLAAARGELFEGQPWFVDGDDVDVAAIVRDCGATLELTTADEHDRAVALTSHLPQILSTALAAYLAEHEEVLRFAGSGLRTFLRLAGSDASVWAPILDANRATSSACGAMFARIAREMLEGDPSEFFRRAQSVILRREDAEGSSPEARETILRRLRGSE